MSSTPNNSLGEAVIQVRADLSKLPGDLAAANEITDKATGGMGTVQPGAAQPTTPTKAPVPTAPDSPLGPAIDEASKVPEKVGPAIDTWDKYTESVKKTAAPGRSFVESLQSQARVLTAFVGTVASVAATLYAATSAGIKFGEQLFINQFDAAKFRHEMERSTKSIEDFNAQREKTSERQFGPDLGGFGVTAVGKKLTEAVEANELAKKNLREFEESGMRRVGVFLDTAAISVGYPPQFGQAVKEEELKYEVATSQATREAKQKQFEGMTQRQRPIGRNGPDPTEMTADNTGEAVRILKMIDVSRRR